MHCCVESGHGLSRMGRDRSGLALRGCGQENHDCALRNLLGEGVLGRRNVSNQ